MVYLILLVFSLMIYPDTLKLFTNAKPFRVAPPGQLEIIYYFVLGAVAPTEHWF
jgi:hypothetical protein